MNHHSPTATDERYAKMERLFAEHGEPSSFEAVSGDATLRDFTVLPTKNNGVEVKLFFDLPCEKTGVVVERPTRETMTPLLGHILEQNYTPSDLSECLKTTISVKKETDGDTWKTMRNEIEITEVSEKPNWNASRRNEMEKLFRQRILTPQSLPTTGDAKIIDYYIRESNPGITQKLEIGIQFKLPDNSIQMFECIHDANHPDEHFKAIYNHFGQPDHLYEIVNETLKAVYDAENARWTVKTTPKPETTNRVLYPFLRLAYLPITKTVPIEKTYSHGGSPPQSKKLNEMRERNTPPQHHQSATSISSDIETTTRTNELREKAIT